MSPWLAGYLALSAPIVLVAIGLAIRAAARKAWQKWGPLP